jgi:hypothetical protein
MLDLTPACFDVIVADPAVRDQLGSLKARRRRRLRFFLIWTIAGLVLGPASFLSLYHAGWGWGSLKISLALLVFPIAIGLSALREISEDLKFPSLTAIAAQAGMTYVEDGFDPPGYPEARELLFGERVTGQLFADLFYGHDEEGRGYAVYDAKVLGSGDPARTLFRGQVYWVERRPTATSATVIVPHRGLLALEGPGGLQRLSLSDDPDLDQRFEAFSDVEAEARQLLSDPRLRNLLLNLRDDGKVYAFIGRYSGFVAAAGSDRFEAGSMLDATSGEDRIRDMIDDVCGALRTLRAVKEALG